MAGFTTSPGTEQLEAGYGFTGRHRTDTVNSAITAKSGGGQSGATKLNSMVNFITTVAAAGDSVQLSQAFPGVTIVVVNNGANPVQMFANQSTSDTINGVAGSTGISIPAGTFAFVTCPLGANPVTGSAGQWFVTGFDTTAPAQQAYNAVSTVNAAITLTGAQITGGTVQVTTDLTGTQAGAVALTLPTVAQLVTAMLAAGLNPLSGMTFELDIIARDASHTYTVTTNTGWTLTGTMTITTQMRRFIVTLTSLTAATLVSIGTQTIGAS